MACRVWFHELPGCRGKMHFLLTGFPFVSVTQCLKPTEKGEEQRGQGEAPSLCRGVWAWPQLAGHELLIDHKSKTSCPRSCGATRALFATGFYPQSSSLSCPAAVMLSGLLWWFTWQRTLRWLRDLRLAWSSDCKPGSKYHGSHSLKNKRVCLSKGWILRHRRQWFPFSQPLNSSCLLFFLCFTSVMPKFLAELIFRSLGISHCIPD